MKKADSTTYDVSFHYSRQSRESMNVWNHTINLGGGEAVCGCFIDAQARSDMDKNALHRL